MKVQSSQAPGRSYQPKPEQKEPRGPTIWWYTESSKCNCNMCKTSTTQRLYMNTSRRTERNVNKTYK